MLNTIQVISKTIYLVSHLTGAAVLYNITKTHARKLLRYVQTKLKFGLAAFDDIHPGNVSIPAAHIGLWPSTF